MTLRAIPGPRNAPIGSGTPGMGILRDDAKSFLGDLLPLSL